MGREPDVCFVAEGLVSYSGRRIGKAIVAESEQTGA
jgi:hypothetical protein